MSQLVDRLKEKRIRVTPQRARICKAFDDCDGFLHPRDIHEIVVSSGIKASISSVYRILSEFEAAGLLKSREFADGRTNYCLASRGTAGFLIDKQTREVIEIRDKVLERRLQKVAAAAGLELVDYDLSLFGELKSKRNSRRV
ncbi:MAG: Fur family transcriptional regulator [Pseudomonadota bacterium]